MQVWAEKFLAQLESELGALAAAQAAQLSADALMPDIPTVIVSADHTGAVLSGQLPRNVAVKRYDGSSDVTTSATWTRTLISGDATTTIGAATGILAITALGSTAVVEVTSVYESISRSRRVLIEKRLSDPPPSSGTGSTSAYDTSISSTASASYGSANAGTLTLECGASGEVELAAPLEITTEAASPAGSFGARGKWQVSAAGAGIWSDVDTEISSASSAVVTEIGGGEYTLTSAGSILVNMTETGLTPGSDYDFRLLLRNASGTRELFYYGTASAVTE